jgi:hypothetical protein
MLLTAAVPILWKIMLLDVKCRSTYVLAWNRHAKSCNAATVAHLVTRNMLWAMPYHSPDPLPWSDQLA